MLVLALVPASFKPVVDFRCGFAAVANPNVVGNTHCTNSCNSIFFGNQPEVRNGVFENRVLVAVNSRKVADTLPVDLFKRRLLGRRKHL